MREIAQEALKEPQQLKQDNTNTNPSVLVLGGKLAPTPSIQNRQPMEIIMRYGYARVSTIDQDTALQDSALASARCKGTVRRLHSFATGRTFNKDGEIRQLYYGNKKPC